MSKFKVGDRVRVKDDYYIDYFRNKHGTIVEEGDICGIEFDKSFFIGHSCNGACKIGYGWNVQEKYLELVKEPKQSIHITTDGKKTVAVLKEGKEVVKRAEAKCSPEDTFEFNIGAKLAFDRLFCCEKQAVEKAKDSDKQVKEVKRKAEGGDYIKITEDIIDLKKGDIRRVWYIGNDHIMWLYDGEDMACGEFVYLPTDYYVVLENYKPETKQVREVKRKAKEGEYIKLTKAIYSFNRVGDILKVNLSYPNGTVVVKSEEHPVRDLEFRDDLNEWGYPLKNYVVLENYKPEEKPKRDTDFKVGDRVRFRSWEDMEKEFGLDADGDINCYCCFSQRMEPLCGTYAKIRKIDGKIVLLKNCTKQFNFSTDMIEKVPKKEQNNG